MRKISFIAALVVAMTAVSCVKEMQTGTPAPEVNGAVTFEASFGAATKAVLDPGATESKVAWEAGDQVGVFAGEGNFLYKAQNAGYSTTLSTEAADVPAEGPYYAVYPYDADAVLAEGVVTTTLPAVQTAVLGSFTTHLSVAQAVENKFAFKNVCGLMGVKIDAENVTKIVLEGNNGEIVAGAINVTVADAPTWTAVAEQGATTVTLAPAEGTLAKGVYYFAVLPQTFEKGFNVKAYKGDDAFVLRNVASAFTLDRSDIVGSKAFGIDGSGTEADPYILKAPQDMVDMRSLAKLGGETWFKMANDIDMQGVKGYLPVNYDGEFLRKIHFDGNNKTISNFTYNKSTDGGDYASLFGVLYGSCRNLKVDNATIVATNGCGVIGGYVGTAGKPAVVENVTITNSSITNSGDRCGGVCGTAKEATFRNVSFQGTVICTYAEKEAKSGGFVGHTETSAVFENCSADVVVSAKQSDIGGFGGKFTGTVSATGCKVKAVVTSSAAQKNRCGGFLGWNSTSSATFTDCHVLKGSSITDMSGRESSTNGNYGGFIGFGDTAGTVLEINDCSAEVDVDGGLSLYNSCFISYLGYASTTTINNCYASGTLKSDGGNQTGGLLGCLEKTAVATITNSRFSGEIKALGGYVGGIAGGVNGKLTLSKTYSTGTVYCGNAYAGGLIGASMNDGVTITNCYSTANVTAFGQQVGGLVGTTTNRLTMSDCFAAGDVYSATSGAGGLVGRVQRSSSIVNCIAWNKNVASSRSANNVYASGAILGCAQEKGTYKGCIRRADMVYVDDFLTLVDHEDCENACPPLPSYSTATHQQAYHGKAAAAGVSLASVAKSLGWDESVWDFSSDSGLSIKGLGDNKIEF